MVRIFVKHKVHDYTAWRKGYDAFEPTRIELGVSAGVILIHFVGVKMTHLGEDGGFLAADDADPGAGSGDQGIRPSRRGNSGDRKAAWLFA